MLFIATSRTIDIVTRLAYSLVLQLALFSGENGAAFAQEPPDSLKLLTTQGKSVQISVRSRKARKASEIQLLRSCAGSELRATHIFSRPRRRQLAFDFPPTDVICTYHALRTWRRSSLSNSLSAPLKLTLPSNQLPQFHQPTLAEGSNCEHSAEDSAVQSTNQFRLANGLPALTKSAGLRAAALRHGQRMSENQSLSHSGWLEDLFGNGYVTGSYAQNIANFVEDGTKVVELWMESPEHRANILNSRFKKVGVGCVRDPQGVRWWAQNFSD